MFPRMQAYFIVINKKRCIKALEGDLGSPFKIDK